MNKKIGRNFDKFEAHFIHKSNETVNRHVFNTRKGEEKVKQLICSSQN